MPDRDVQGPRRRCGHLTRAELGIGRVAMPTNGNAGAAWSAYAARAGVDALVVMPIDAPEVTRRECSVAGARLLLVDGLIGDAGAIVGRAVRDDGWFDVSTLKEPYRLEGKKTMGLEIFEQLGRRMPDAIIYSRGRRRGPDRDPQGGRRTARARLV